MQRDVRRRKSSSIRWQLSRDVDADSTIAGANTGGSHVTMRPGLPCAALDRLNFNIPLPERDRERSERGKGSVCGVC